MYRPPKKPGRIFRGPRTKIRGGSRGFYSGCGFRVSGLGLIQDLGVRVQGFRGCAGGVRHVDRFAHKLPAVLTEADRA